MRSNAKCDQQIHLWADSSPDRELRNQGFHSVVCTLVQCENPSCSLCLPREFAQLEHPGREERPPIMPEIKVTINPMQGRMHILNFPSIYSAIFNL